MPYLGYVVGVAAVAGIIIAILAAKASRMQKENKPIDREALLEEAFGDHMYADCFSYSEAVEWIKQHKEALNQNAKALVMKVNDETMNAIGQNLHLGQSMDNYLLIAVVDMVTKEMLASILVKYDLKVNI